MNDILFDEAHYNESDELTLSTSGCGCCADYYSSYSCSSWKVSLDALDEYIKRQRKSLDRLADFVAKQRAAGNTEYTCKGDYE